MTDAMDEANAAGGGRASIGSRSYSERAEGELLRARKLMKAETPDAQTATMHLQQATALAVLALVEELRGRK